MTRFLSVIVTFSIVVAFVAASQDVPIFDLNTMSKGDKGKLPKTKGNDRYYEVGRVIDDVVLIGLREKEGKTLKVTARFFIRDAELVKQFEKSETGAAWIGSEVTLPDVTYLVVGRRKIDKSTYPVITAVKQK
jgi:hypothetical protein